MFSHSQLYLLCEFPDWLKVFLRLYVSIGNLVEDYSMPTKIGKNAG
jgi:hypothetical protein